MPDSGEAKLRVLVVDDHPMVREGLRSMLSGAVTGWAEAGTGEEALTKLAELQPDVVLLDLELPDVDGLTLLRRIRALSPKTRVLIVTMHDKLEFVRQAMTCGAAGYVLKGASRKELLAILRTAGAGGPVIEPGLLRRLLEEDAAPSSRSRPGGGAPDTLTLVERDVLALVTRGLTNKEIAQHLRWSVATVKKYVQRILEKLEVTDRTQAAAEAVRRGLVGDNRPGPSRPPRSEG